MNKSTMLSITAEHAVRALSEMAAKRNGESVLGKELAVTAGIPPNYLAKILWTLGNAGLIDATRGSGGGYRLRRAPSEIRLREIVDLFDRQAWRTSCFLSSERLCDPDCPCAVHQDWDRVRSAYLGFLDSTTIAQIAGMRSDGIPNYGEAGNRKERE
jgi:Rrf2 family protein